MHWPSSIVPPLRPQTPKIEQGEAFTQRIDLDKGKLKHNHTKNIINASEALQYIFFRHYFNVLLSKVSSWRSRGDEDAPKLNVTAER